MSFSVHEEVQKGVLILQIEGRLDATTAPLFEEKVNEQFEKGIFKQVFDLGKVDYLSSAGMRVLLMAGKKIEASKGKLLIACVSKEVMEVLKMAGFDRIFDFYPSVDASLKAF